MQVRYDPCGGLIISLPVYEGEMAMKLMRLIIKEVAKQDQDTDCFIDVVTSILQYTVRLQ